MFAIPTYNMRILLKPISFGVVVSALAMELQQVRRPNKLERGSAPLDAVIKVPFPWSTNEAAADDGEWWGRLADEADGAGATIRQGNSSTTHVTGKMNKL